MNKFLRHRVSYTLLQFFAVSLLVASPVAFAISTDTVSDHSLKSFHSVVDIPEWNHPTGRRYIALNKLIETSMQVKDMTEVPYVWGGASLGSDESCQQCNACLAEKQSRKGNRSQKCPSCNRCGVDCSHLVLRVFAQAGFDYKYAPSATLGRAPAPLLLSEFNLVDIGNDFSQALPGDIMVYRRHVGILVTKREGPRGDLLHASRQVRFEDRPFGGIRLNHDTNVVRARGGLIRILRHSDLFVPVPIVPSQFEAHLVPMRPSAKLTQLAAN